jgi:hypothetical protein
MNIDCPGTGTTVRVAGGTICVHGVLTDGDAAQLVVARVLAGWGLQIPQSPFPLQAGDVQAPVVGQSFCAQGVAIPIGAATGAQLTAAAWLLAAGEPAGSDSKPFLGGGGNPTDCCAACGGSGMVPEFFLAEALTEETDLTVSIPSGENAGTHRAVSVASRTWQLTVAGATYTVAVSGQDWVIRGPSGSISADGVELDPFSATFAGDFFGSDDDVVLTIE